MLLDEYRLSLKAARKMRETALEEDDKIFAGMIGDLEYAIKWMTDLRRPEVKKAQNRVLSDPDMIERTYFLDAFADPYSPSVFERIEKKIDTERRQARRA